MQRRHLAALQLFRRARDFLVRAQPTVSFGEIALQVAALGEVIDRITALTIEQETHVRLARAGTAAINHQMRLLRWELMRPFELSARQIVINGVSLGGSFRVAPRIRQPEALSVAAMGMAHRAEEFAPAFVAAGFPTDFADRMRAGATALREAVDSRAHHLGRRAATTAALADAVTHGRQVLSIVDSMVGPSAERDPVLAAEWNEVLRGRGARRVREEGA